MLFLGNLQVSKNKSMEGGGVFLLVGEMEDWTYFLAEYEEEAILSANIDVCLYILKDDGN